MPQSLAQVYLHIVFSTKYREPFIQPQFRPDLYRYLAAVCSDKECRAVIVGGYSDHVHILCELSRKVAIMDLVEAIKTYSSRWMKQRAPELRNFYWQNGYAVFSVSKRAVQGVVRYIERQEAHHSGSAYQVEMRSYFDQYQIPYDERYVWD